MRRVPAILFLAALVLGSAYAANAQLPGIEPLTLTMTPSYPRPYQSVTIVPQSTVINLAASRVTATVNGTVVSEGSGAEPIYVTVGGPGTATNVTVRAVTGGQTYSKSLTIRPADVALVVEPASTVHPFYKGGSLIASEGRVRLIALPDLRTSSGSVIAPDSLVYTWRNGDQILESASGIGKSVLTATSPVRYRDARITVTVTSQDRSVVAEATALVSPSDPVLRVYRNDPLLGPLFGAALSQNITLAGTEESFRAVPYFFAARPSVTWEVNGAVSDTDPDITVRATGAGSGRALITASASGGTQSASSAFRVDFGEDGGFNFFGL